VDAATQAEAALASGDPKKAYAAMGETLDTVWNEIPLTIQKALFTAADPQGFGIYDLRDSNEFKSSQPLVIYSEPVGYGYGRDGDLYTINMDLDFVVKTAEGEELGGQKSFSQWQLKSRVPNREFMGKLTYTLDGIEPGDYIITTTVRDQNSDETTSFDMPFKIVP
jgi:hypothetical protein